MRAAVMVNVAAAMLMISSASVSAKNEGRCRAYWMERNTLLKDYRYCLKSQRAIRYFGNDDCIYERVDDIPFNKSDRERLQEIRAMERTNRCTALSI